MSSINPNAVNGFLANPCTPTTCTVYDKWGLHCACTCSYSDASDHFVANCLQSLNISFTVLILTVNVLKAMIFFAIFWVALSSSVSFFTGVAPPSITR